MAHVRQQILDAVVTGLTGLSTTDSRVYAGRSIPMSADNLPGLCIYGRLDSPDYSRGTMACKPARQLELVVEGYAKPATDAALNTIAAEVETAIYLVNLSSLAHGLELGEQEIELDDEGERNVGVIRMVFNVWYSTVEGAPETAV